MCKCNPTLDEMCWLLSNNKITIPNIPDLPHILYQIIEHQQLLAGSFQHHREPVVP